MKTRKNSISKKQKGKKCIKGGKSSLEELPPNEINKYIDNIIYINLDKRTNRNEQITRELTVFNREKVYRLSAVDNAITKQLGCLTSHLNALKLARDNKYPNVLILEDDAMWANIKIAYPIFKMLVEKPYDVIMLGGTFAKYNKTTYRVISSLAASSYLVNSSYYDTIIAKVEEQLKIPDGKKEIDTIYTLLQKEDKWFIVVPALMIQRPSHSNIAGGPVNYKRFF
jgi:glycosyl transferase family 25